MTLSVKLAAALTAVDFAADGTVRRFSGVAHSGKPFVQYDVPYIVDLSNIAYRDRVAVLVEHSPDRKAGAGSLSLGQGGLLINGTLLDNEHGRDIATSADQGFPWEMSAYIQAARWEELAAGATATVNGQELTGPMVIMRDCTVREVSFVAVGVDKHTSAVVLSDSETFKPDLKPKQESQNMTKEEQAEFDKLKAELEAEKAKSAELEKAKAAAEKKAQVDKKLSAAGAKPAADGNGFDGISAATYELLLSASPEAADALIADLKLSAAAEKPPLPPSLTGDTAPAETPQGDGVKLSAAEATNPQGQKYV
ncbi:hypothetical protein LNQ82_02815 [Conchiformibius steedae DSM 2580]|uniref:Uncharacterized protein n=2 Tax=Conchiformibius steedae TaxID=153493 RepID=A0AAE9HTW8_9NEIS|nr:hypothetical protein [Conchiformibius steedae]QMT33457.1 hypothetical protein H3L98_10340 [Conchiformibius steedae]URD68112.1 hypothetical protein LNQ82_02815 [Conchiformibius steedae DSM 2580]